MPVGGEPIPEAEIASLLKRLFSRCVAVPESDLPDDEPFFSLGLNSLTHGEILAGLMRSFPQLASTVLFEHPNFRLLARHIGGLKPTRDEMMLAVEPGDFR